MTLTPRKRELVDEVLRHDDISDDDVLLLRREVWPDGAVDSEEIDLLFDLDARPVRKAESWNAFFAEAVAQRYVWQGFPPGVVSEPDADEFLRRVRHDGRIEAESEFRALVRIVEQAKWVPERLVMAGLEAVKDVVLHHDGRLAQALRHRPGAIDAADVAVIRKLLHGVAGDGSIGISRAEADLLADLNDATRDADNDPAWADLFARSIGSYVLLPGRAVLDVDAHVRQERWLQERGSTGEFMARMGQALRDGGGLMAAFKDVTATLFGGSTAHEREMMERLDAQARREQAAAAISPAEQQWLLERIGKGPAPTAAERALLDFLRRQAPELPEALAPLLARG